MIFYQREDDQAEGPDDVEVVRHDEDGDQPVTRVGKISAHQDPERNQVESDGDQRPNELDNSNELNPSLVDIFFGD